MSKVLLYLHGFKSSPLASKAQAVERYIQQRDLPIRYIRPDIPDTPSAAIPFLRQLFISLQGQDVSIIGSSLGGYYATWLAHEFGHRAVLVNPAVHPHRLWHKYIGLHQNPYSGVQFAITAAHLDDLAAIYYPAIICSANFTVLLQTGDEVLDALEASRAFYRSSCMIECGGDHQFQGFDRYLPHIMRWLHLE